MGLGQALNDQVQYIAGARNLLDTGKLETTVIYPSTLAQVTKTKILYVPGHYWVLAASFALLGVHYWSSILFSLLGFYSVVICLYLCGERLFGKKTALIAACLIMFFPFFLLFSLTAMAEMNVMASFLIAFTLFLYLSQKKRLVLAPLLAMLPVCFRETSLVVIFPMAAVIWSESIPQDRVKNTLKFLGSSLVLSLLVIKVFFGGRPDLIKANVFGSFNEIYTDAFFSLRFHPTLLQWVETCSQRFFNHLWFLATDISFSAESMTLKVLLILSVVIFVRGVKRKHLFESSVGVMCLVLFGAILSIYAVTGYRGLRVSLLTAPFVILIVSDWIASFKIRKVSLAIFVAGVLLVSVKRSMWDLVRTFSEEREKESKVVEFVDKIHPDNEKIIIAPFWFVMPWLSENYPARWSMLPANNSTFRLLQGVGPIGTILIHESELSQLSWNDFKLLGYEMKEELKFEGLKFFVLRSSSPTS